MTKRVFALILCISLMVVMFAGCSGEKEEPKTDETNVSTEGVVKEYVLKGDYLDIYKTLEAPEESKFFGTAIVNVRPEEYRDNELPVISKDCKDAQLILSLMHLEDAWMDEYAIACSQSTTRAYTVAILKGKSGYEQNIVSGIETRINDLNRILVNYPDQMYILDNMVMEQVGSYLLIIICDNADKVYNEFYKIMESCDLADLGVVPLMSDEERQKIEEEDLQKEIDKIEASVNEVEITPVEDPELETFDESVEETTSNNSENIE